MRVHRRGRSRGGRPDTAACNLACRYGTRIGSPLDGEVVDLAAACTALLADRGEAGAEGDER